VRQVREIVLNGVDWDCEVKTLFRDENLGCKYGVSGGIDWFFENEEEGIILEDDTLPSQSFFWFCQELLEKYRTDERIMMIGGNNKGVNFSSDYSYFFSKYVQIWGWATWRRSWGKYDCKIQKWKSVKEQIGNYVYSKNEMRLRIKQFDSVYNHKTDTWDFQWNFICLIHNGLAIIPYLNMISNIGFSDDATHTNNKNDKLRNLKRCEIKWPLFHPDYILYNSIFEKKYQPISCIKLIMLKCVAPFKGLK
jgi:hypothetical protein